MSETSWVRVRLGLSGICVSLGSTAIRDPLGSVGIRDPLGSVGIRDPLGFFGIRDPLGSVGCIHLCPVQFFASCGEALGGLITQVLVPIQVPTYLSICFYDVKMWKIKQAKQTTPFLANHVILSTIRHRSLGGKSAAAPDGKSIRFVCACDTRLVYLMSDWKEILGLGGFIIYLSAREVLLYNFRESTPPDSLSASADLMDMWILLRHDQSVVWKNMWVLFGKPY